MGGETAAKPSLRGPLRGEDGAPKGVVDGGAEGGGGSGENISVRGESDINQRSRGGGDG